MYHRPGASVPGQKVFLATPAYEKLGAGYAYALFHTQSALSAAGIGCELAIFSGDCHVDDARNRLVRDFLEGDCTDLVFLDADVRWQPSDLVKLCQYDRDVVGATYHLKQDDSALPCRFLGSEIWADSDGLIEVETVPTGFLKIRRHVLQKLYDAAPKFRPKSDFRSDFGEVFRRDIMDGNRWGGDSRFCRLWRDMGGKVYVSPEMTMEHSGDKVWEGSLGAWLRKKNGTTVTDALSAISGGVEIPEMWSELHSELGNDNTLSADCLAVVAAIARKTDGPVIEFGSGLSTLVLSAIGKDVTSFEHDEEWLNHTVDLLKSCSMNGVAVVRSQLTGDDPFYSPSGRYDLAVCDGPPRRLAPNRRGLWRVLHTVLNPGGRFIIDDIDNPDAEADLKSWAEKYGAEYQIVRGIKTFAVGQMP